MEIKHLYFHFPFCSTVCPYCGFYVTTAARKEIYLVIEALIREVELLSATFRLNPQTLFIGGGTPSLAKPAEIDRLLAAIPKENVKEITIEANPRTVTLQKAVQWKESGINRVSLGVQSLDEKELLILGRRHKPKDVVDSVNALRKGGIENINLDFIFGIPTQSVESFKRSLYRGLELSPKHISLYCLTYEEGTPFFEEMKKGRFVPDEKKEIEMMEMACELLADHGFVRYEVSNFALPGYQSLHNKAYWQGKDYLGIGPSACSTVGNKRWSNLNDYIQYVQELKEGRLPIKTMESLDEELKKKERLFLALRTDEGITLGQGGEEEKRTVEWLVEEGLGYIKENRFILTNRGFLLADEIALYFL
ncbi:radical SAM family heme chaperone HemW [Candidatus Methylacidiphilum infernorum]|uniref:Heme chaperone HemW n=1 Tax=Candidatus Methylacidiphilum infernorum TaxID=511746 RepID=A0ABX7PTK4_9BACT|nr:radical SAM family heme chaperone HemW [Candidatus Methylacidiphilum infernorum]QSR86232.1 radical SAM family heme chaperone HemW [Candidatus Methylacidiphilum infernorum]